MYWTATVGKPWLWNHANLYKSDCKLQPLKGSTQLRCKSELLLFRVPRPRSRPRRHCNNVAFTPTMQIQDSSVKMEVDVPASVAYQCYLDRESIPQWMPFISSVKVVEDKPDLSRWTLKYTAFGRDIQFSWLARNLQPIPNQKIHWRSLEGLPNSGAVRFFPKGPSSCLIELTVSYEVPQILAPVASALQPFLQSLLLQGLERFSNFTKSRYQTQPPDLLHGS
ncbi:hypothetical protein RND81_06G149600 [Saponaria officinalis]|uniref:Coenzyme Q-binding protein COQ10 START domain-containing protein n=1 Tax=Saponaria officinalis TaxID=3572 RepID=A0AAW1KD89_SAPOF